MGPWNYLLKTLTAFHGHSRKAGSCPCSMEGLQHWVQVAVYPSLGVINVSCSPGGQRRIQPDVSYRFFLGRLSKRKSSIFLVPSWFASPSNLPTLQHKGGFPFPVLLAPRAILLSLHTPCPTAGTHATSGINVFSRTGPLRVSTSTRSRVIVHSASVHIKPKAPSSAA